MTEVEEWQKKALRKYRGAVSRSQGLLHEKMIEAGCQYYRQIGKAYIVKEPEPFRVLKKDKRTGRAMIQFVRHAQPDFHGTLKDGLSIVFEAKHTQSDRIKQDVITPEQAASLTIQEKLGAAAFVCAGIEGRAFMVPWAVFSNMKDYYGRKYATAEDLSPFEVVQDMCIKFLEYKK
jgi:recombination protein U